MEATRKKWIRLGGFGAIIGAFLVFLFSATSRKDPHETRPSRMAAAPAPVESTDHELKALAMQLQKKPGHVPVLMRMAQLERDKGQMKDAVTHLREVLKTEPSNSDAHLELGRLLYETGDVNGAITETEKVLVVDPAQADALYNLGAIYANLGNSQRARSYWTKASETAPSAEIGRKARESLAKLGGA